MARKSPRDHHDTLASPQSGRPMVRGDKEIILTVDGERFTYLQLEGQRLLSDWPPARDRRANHRRSSQAV